jgi:hypothetical protein
MFSIPLEVLQSPAARKNPAARAAVAQVDRIIMEADGLLAAAIGQRLLPRRRRRRRRWCRPRLSFWPASTEGVKLKK